MPFRKNASFLLLIYLIWVIAKIFCDLSFENIIRECFTILIYIYIYINILDILSKNLTAISIFFFLLIHNIGIGWIYFLILFIWIYILNTGIIFVRFLILFIWISILTLMILGIFFLILFILCLYIWLCSVIRLLFWY